jgi:hypothetical protein
MWSCLAWLLGRVQSWLLGRVQSRLLGRVQSRWRGQYTHNHQLPCSELPTRSISTSEQSCVQGVFFLGPNIPPAMTISRPPHNNQGAVSSLGLRLPKVVAGRVAHGARLQNVRASAGCPQARQYDANPLPVAGCAATMRAHELLTPSTRCLVVFRCTAEDAQGAAS